MKKTILLLATILAFTGCKDAKEDVKADVKETQIEAAKTFEDVGVKLYALDGGTVVANQLEIFSQGDMYHGESKVFADPYYIIEHKNGRLLWDAGLAENLIGKEPVTTPNGAFTVSRKASVVEQLKLLNLTPKDFDFIALSHTHFDHTGSASEFAEATWLVQETEHHYITSDEQKKGDNYMAIAALTNVRKLNGDHDVFGDGTVVIKSMPGHTPGHQVLFLKLENAGNLLLTGDLYHFQENRDNRGVPSFNYDVDETLNSMLKFETYAKNKNADVYIQHSPDDFNRLPKYPKYLD
ncbi:MAG: N-acyl homoserine lactonase family protein [Winogradskyella sp.]|uniref:N-acyl homoserine lactonase family protein n=1 Tax=Winogradskyella sp. TaxID=1883156 RepID=UPI003859A5AB